MAKKTVWMTEEDNEKHTIEFIRRPLSKSVWLIVDGESFELAKKPARSEPFRLGEAHAVLVLDKKGRATVVVEGQELAPSSIK